MSAECEGTQHQLGDPIPAATILVTDTVTTDRGTTTELETMMCAPCAMFFTVEAMSLWPNGGTRKVEVEPICVECGGNGSGPLGADTCGSCRGEGTPPAPPLIRSAVSS